MKELLEKKITITTDEFLEKVSEVSLEFSKRIDEPKLAIILSLYSAELAAKLFVEPELPKREERKEEKTKEEKYFRVEYQPRDIFNCEKGDVGLLVGKKDFFDGENYILYNKKWNGYDGKITKYKNDRHCLYFHPDLLEEVKE